MNAEDFFSAPEQNREPSRPKAVNPLTGKEQSWTRASNFAAALDNPHGLIKTRQRDLIRGLALRHDLLRMLLSGATIEDPAKVDEVIASALGTQELDAKANNGTAIHAALTRSWLHGIGEVAVEFHKYVHAFAAALKEYGLKPVATEQTVLNTRRGSRGTFDWAFQESDGECVIGDVKSGRLDVAKRKFAVQLLNYAEADYQLHSDGSASPIPFAFRKPYAVLVHIDPETAAVSVYKIDLIIGAYGAELAEKVRQWHGIDPMSPYSPPLAGLKVQPTAPVLHHTQTSSVTGPIVVTEPRPASVADALTTHGVFDPHPGITVNEHGEDGVTVNEHPSPAVSAPETTEPSPAPSGAEQAPEKPYNPAERFDALMKGLEKAELQMRLKARGWTDLSHNRRWLARALVCLEQGWTDEKMIRKYAAAKDDEQTPPPITSHDPLERTTDELRPDRREVALEAIAGAKSVGALAAFHGDFVRRHGDAAWTDELAHAASARTTELDGVDHAAVLARIEACEEQGDLAELWSEITLGGSVKSLWAPFDAAAKARMGVIRDKMMTQKADENPFG